jgi:malonyl-CoA O-methyltransferase
MPDIKPNKKFDKKITRQHFEKAADSYDAAAVLQLEIAKRMGQRLDYIKLQPDAVLDAGCGTGFITKDLLKRYPKSKIIALDLALNMTRKTKEQGGWLRKPKLICADAEQLPLKDKSVDLLVSNLMIQWSNDLGKMFAGFHSVLKPNGLLLFSTFGPDTLKEMRESWSCIDDTPHTSSFVDMHEIGDALLQAGFINPVTDMELITMTYSNVRQLMKDIKEIGAINTNNGRSKGLMGKQKLKAFEQAYEQFKTEDGLYPASWEVIYGHAWVGEGLKLEGFEKFIPIQAV